MDFTPRTIVNGSLLRNFIGKNVSTIVNFPEKVQAGQKLIKGKTTDNIEIRIQLAESLNAPFQEKDWVEVIGVPAGTDTIRCSEIITFNSHPSDEPFDAESHNMLVQLINNCTDIYKLDHPK